MITNTGTNKIATMMKNLISKGMYTIDGVTKEIEIQKFELKENILSVYLYLDDTISGTVTNVKLIDIDNEVFADKPDNIKKLNTQGILIVFKFTITEV